MTSDTADTTDIQEVSDSTQEATSAKPLGPTGMKAMQGESPLGPPPSPGSPPVPGDWVDRGIQDVPVAGLPDPEGVDDAGDFKKVPLEEMKVGLTRLQEMKPVIDSGEGANTDYWHELDHQRGLAYPDGYQKVYESFYGQDAIRLDKDGDQYDIVNGRHRIFMAKQMGIGTLPARVIEKVPA